MVLLLADYRKQVNDLFDRTVAKHLAKQYADVNGFLHACRVADYVMSNSMIPAVMLDDCVSLSYLHDLVEDTTFDVTVLPEGMQTLVLLISRSECESYMDYIWRIKMLCTVYPEVYWVKMADIKDHISLVDTLTDRLRDKYLEALRCLL